MKKLSILLFIIITTISCSESTQITITKLEGSPKYENSKLKLNELTFDQKYNFSFGVDNYQMGEQTSNDFKFKLANSEKGQHIHFIINNAPYSAHYSENFSKKLEEGNNVILAFLSRFTSTSLTSSFQAAKLFKIFPLTPITKELPSKTNSS